MVGTDKAFKEARGIEGEKRHLSREDAFKEGFFGWDKNKAFLEGNIFEEFKEGNFLH